jgi:hypothetical protein
MATDPRDDDAFDEAIARHYARQQEGLPPALEPHPGYATLIEAWVAHQEWLEEEFRLGRLPAYPLPALPDSPPEE